jgi:hypothetical protein
LDSIRLWWAHVTEIPEASKIAVLRRGIWKGLKGIIPVGGQWAPSSGVGDNLE